MISKRTVILTAQKGLKKIETIVTTKNKQFYIYLGTVIVLLLIAYGLYHFYNSSSISNNYKKGTIVPTVNRPFLNLFAVKKDGSEVATNIIFITHAFTRDECEVLYNDYKKSGAHFLGLSSYSEFPGPISNPHDVLHDPKNKANSYNYFDLTRGWCTVFREELNKQWIKEGVPRINLAESDFANYETHKPDPNVKKEYDFIYVCLKDNDKCEPGWQSHIRSWEYVEKILEIMCTKYKLKGLLVGRVGCKVPNSCHQLMELTDFMEYNKFIGSFNKCRFILTASMADASPRSLTEAMCYNLPCLVNKNILGGWQYVNDETGAFFDANDINSFEPVLKQFLEKLDKNEYHPRDWFIKNYGKYNSGKRLKEFVQSVFKEDELNVKFEEVEYMKPGI
jgi:hypothetical protein